MDYSIVLMAWLLAMLVFERFGLFFSLGLVLVSLELTDWQQFATFVVIALAGGAFKEFRKSVE